MDMTLWPAQAPRRPGTPCPSEQRYRLLFEGNPLPLWVFDLATMRILDVNDAACRKYGYSREEFLRMDARALRPPEEVPRLEACLRREAPGTREFGRWRHRLRDGREIVVEVVAHELRLDGRRAMFVCPVDVTALHEAKAALRELNAQLERRVADRTAELEAANRELEAFDYSVAHDLRGPLAAVRGFAEALLLDCGAALGENGRGYVAQIARATDRMDELVGDLLQLSLVSRGQLQREDVDVAQLATEVIAAVRERHPGREVAARVAPGLAANADRRLLRIVLENLLCNAWKFTSRRAEARVEVGASGGALFVADNGAGFDPARAERLFTPFHRLHRQGEFPGTGIGLAIVQRIVQRHGGRVWAEGAPERGATLRFTLSR